MKKSYSLFKKYIFLTILLISSTQEIQAMPTNKGNSNSGNDCFLNATVQALFHLKPFREFLDWAKANNIYAENSMPKALIDHIDMMAENKNIIDPSTFRQKFASCSTKKSITKMKKGQRDAEDFYSNLIEQLWIELQAMNLAKSNFVTIFDRKLDKSIIERFWFSLSEIPEKNLTDIAIKTWLTQVAEGNKMDAAIKNSINSIQNYESVTQLFKEIDQFKQTKLYPLFGKSLTRKLECIIDSTHSQIFSKIEQDLTNDQRPWIWPLAMNNSEKTFDELIRKKIEWKCSQKDCPAKGQIQTPTEKIKITETPAILAFQFKRFISDNYGITSKINRLFVIPEKLSSNPETLMWDGNFDYVLSAIVIQSGDLSSGHYWAYGRWYNDSKWYYYNDMGDKARAADANEMNTLLSPSDLENKSSAPTPYLLFYVKTEKPAAQPPVIPAIPPVPVKQPKPEKSKLTAADQNLVTKLTGLSTELKKFDNELTALKTALENLKNVITTSR